jgi:hypothetical protein
MLKKNTIKLFEMNLLGQATYFLDFSSKKNRIFLILLSIASFCGLYWALFVDFESKTPVQQKIILWQILFYFIITLSFVIYMISIIQKENDNLQRFHLINNKLEILLKAKEANEKGLMGDEDFHFLKSKLTPITPKDWKSTPIGDISFLLDKKKRK